MNIHWANPEIYVDELNGEIINDSIFERNTRIEDKFDVHIKAHFDGNPTQAAQNSIRADSDDYDVVSTCIRGGASSLVLNGQLLNLNEVPYIDLEKPWWDQNAADQLSVLGKLYVTISDLGYRDKEATDIFMFNKTVIENYRLEDPYQLVRDKKWTFEKMYEMAEVVSADTNGNGEHDQDDTYGILSQTHTPMQLAAGGGVRIAANNEEGVPEIVFMSEKNEAIFTKIFDMLADHENAFFAQDFTGVADIWTAQLEMMNDNRALFFQTLMNRVLLLRSYDCDFGIIPQPFMIEGQDEYISPVDMACTSSVCIPVIASNPERTGIILEALTADSHYSLIPAYYEVAIKGKSLRDEESLEMFDIIFGNRVYDLGEAYEFGGIIGMITNMGINGQNNLASQYAKVEKLAAKNIERFVETIQDIDANKAAE